MRVLRLTLTVQAMLPTDKLLIIKFIRNISNLSLKEAKDFVEAVLYPGGNPAPVNSKVNFKVPMTSFALQTLCELNNGGNTRLPGLKIDVFIPPAIFNLDPNFGGERGREATCWPGVFKASE